MKWLEYYGNPIFNYRGRGNFKDNKLPPLEENVPPVSFEVAQLSDGRIFCECKSPYDEMREIGEGDSIIGKTEYGYEITITNLIVLTVQLSGTHRPYEVTLQAMIIGEVDIKIPNPLPSGQLFEIHFFLTNFKFGQVWLVPLQWTVDDYLISIEPLPNHKEKVQIIKGTRNTGITTKAKVLSLNNLSEISYAVELVAHLCSLLSLTQGCHVHWICYEALSNKNQVIEKRHRLAGPLSPRGSYLFPAHPEDDIKNFISQCLPNYRKKDEIWNLSLIISTYVDAIGQQLLENRGLQLSILMDVIRGIYLKNQERNRLIDEETFSRIHKDLKKEVKKILSEFLPQANSRDLKKMVSHVPIFQWYPFSPSLLALCKTLNLKIPDYQVKRLIEERNYLAHTGRFSDDNRRVEICNEMTALISKIILALLEYDGYYYDWSIPPYGDWTNRRVKTSPIK